MATMYGERCVAMAFPLNRPEYSPSSRGQAPQAIEAGKYVGKELNLELPGFRMPLLPKKERKAEEEKVRKKRKALALEDRPRKRRRTRRTDGAPKKKATKKAAETQPLPDKDKEDSGSSCSSSSSSSSPSSDEEGSEEQVMAILGDGKDDGSADHDPKDLFPDADAEAEEEAKAAARARAVHLAAAKEGKPLNIDKATDDLMAQGLDDEAATNEAILASKMISELPNHQQPSSSDGKSPGGAAATAARALEDALHKFIRSQGWGRLSSTSWNSGLRFLDF
jgi:cell division protein FtsN